MKAHNGLQFEIFISIELHPKKGNADPNIITAVFRKPQESCGIEQVRFDSGLYFLKRLCNRLKAIDLHARGIVLFEPVGTREVAENRFHFRA